MRKHGVHNPPQPATMADVRDAMLKLARSVDSVRTSIDSMCGRLKVQSDSERTPPSGALWSALFEGRNWPDDLKAELTEIRNWVRAMDHGMDDIFADVRVIRAHMDAVANNAYLRDEFKGLLSNG